MVQPTIQDQHNTLAVRKKRDNARYLRRRHGRGKLIAQLEITQICQVSHLLKHVQCSSNPFTYYMYEYEQMRAFSGKTQKSLTQW